MKIVLLAVAGLLAAPGLARAELATIAARDLPVASGRAPAGVLATPRFTMVGLHWQGAGGVSFRTRSLAGGWSPWRPAAPEGEDGPDRVGSEWSHSGWKLGNPYWSGASDGLEYRLYGTVRRLRAYFVWSAPAAAPIRALSLAGSPLIVPRRSWNANELLKRGPPEYAPAVRFAVVHHTAGSNQYTRAQSAAIVRGIQIYHVRANGWKDIGYNFLVDKYGQVFEGRYGGVDRPVIGAHAEGFNTGSAGIAVIGNYQAASLPAATRRSLTDLLAWRLDVAHADPLSTFSWASLGNPKLPAGKLVFLRTIVGHRDVGFTACPGNRVYTLLDELARTVARTGLPKLYDPLVRGPNAGKVRFSGRLSSAAPWTVVVADADGQMVASGSGRGAAIDWTWSARGAAGGRYHWSIGGTGVRPATGVVVLKQGTPAPPAFALTEVVADPVAFTPNGDGQDDSTTISYRLNAPAFVTAKLYDAAERELATLLATSLPAGPQSLLFSGQGVADGTYRIGLTAVDAQGKRASGSATVIVNRVLSAFAASRRAFSPNADGRIDTLRLGFTLASPAQVTLRVLRAGAEVAVPLLAAALEPGRQQLSYDGIGPAGPLADGLYEAELVVTDVVGTVSQRVPFAIDTVAPELRLTRIRPLRFQVSEPADVVLWLDGVRRVIKAKRAGTHGVSLPSPARRVRAVAWDTAGNTSAPVRFP